MPDSYKVASPWKLGLALCEALGLDPVEQKIRGLTISVAIDEPPQVVVECYVPEESIGPIAESFDGTVLVEESTTLGDRFRRYSVKRPTGDAA